MTIKQKTEVWFKARKGRLTASSAGAVLGCDPYRTRADVMRAMVREWHDAEPEFTGNIATEYGEKMEPTARRIYEMQTGLMVEDGGFFVHPHCDWLGASPDGITEKGLLEIKCPFSLRDSKEPVFKTIADMPHYYAQVQIQLYCTDREVCDFFQYAPEARHFPVEEVEANEYWIAENLPRLEAFYQSYLVEREFPAAQKHIDPIYQEVDDQDISLLCEIYEEHKDAARKSDQDAKDILEIIIERTGGRPSKIGRFTLSAVTRKGAIQYAKAVKDLLPEADLEPYQGNPTTYYILK